MAEPNRAREVAEQVTAEPRYHSDIEIDLAEAYLALSARCGRMEEALRGLIGETQGWLDAHGGCEHDNNICVCDSKRTLEAARAALEGDR